ncbi:MAG: hypothetical protein AB1640_16380 [bacterium]
MIQHTHLGALKALPLVLGAIALAFGCGDIPGDADETGSVINVEMITGVYDGQDSNTVDAVQDLCVQEEGPVEAEPFFDHFARALITNRSLPNSTEQSASPVYIHSYTVTYQLAGNVPAPNLDPYVEVPLLDSRGIEPCQSGSQCAPTEYVGLKFMDVAKRAEYVSKGGDPFQEATYNINYTFRGENLFGEDFTFGGSTNFTITDYDNCD